MAGPDTPRASETLKGLRPDPALADTQPAPSPLATTQPARPDPALADTQPAPSPLATTQPARPDPALADTPARRHRPWPPRQPARPDPALADARPAPSPLATTQPARPDPALADTQPAPSPLATTQPARPDPALADTQPAPSPLATTQPARPDPALADTQPAPSPLATTQRARPDPALADTQPAPSPLATTQPARPDPALTRHRGGGAARPRHLWAKNWGTPERDGPQTPRGRTTITAGTSTKSIGWGAAVKAIRTASGFGKKEGHLANGHRPRFLGTRGIAGGASTSSLQRIEYVVWTPKQLTLRPFPRTCLIARTGPLGGPTMTTAPNPPPGLSASGRPPIQRDQRMTELVVASATPLLDKQDTPKTSRPTRRRSARRGSRRSAGRRPGGLPRLGRLCAFARTTTARRPPARCCSQDLTVPAGSIGVSGRHDKEVEARTRAPRTLNPCLSELVLVHPRRPACGLVDWRLTGDGR